MYRRFCTTKFSERKSFTKDSRELCTLSSGVVTDKFVDVKRAEQILDDIARYVWQIGGRVYVSQKDHFLAHSCKSWGGPTRQHMPTCPICMHNMYIATTIMLSWYLIAMKVTLLLRTKHIRDAQGHTISVQRSI